MAAIYSNGGNRWNILGFTFTKRDALSSVYKISMAVTDTLGRRPQNRKLRANNAIEKIKKELLTKDRVTAKSLVLHPRFIRTKALTQNSTKVLLYMYLTLSS